MVFMFDASQYHIIEERIKDVLIKLNEGNNCIGNKRALNNWKEYSSLLFSLYNILLR